MEEVKKEPGIKLIYKIACETAIALIVIFCAIMCLCNDRSWLMLAVFGVASGVVAAKDIVRYKNGERTVARSEMGKSSPKWVRVAIAVLGVAVLAFVVFLFTCVID